MNFKKLIPYIAALLVLAGLVAICLTATKKDDPDPTESTSITEITSESTTEPTTESTTESTTGFVPSPDGSLEVR